jgi:two-component system cell cycle sensor histidine kinase/response regulator CckA
MRDGDRTGPADLVASDLVRFFDLSSELCCIADDEGHFLRLNAAWESTLGHPLPVLLAGAYMDFVHPEDRAATEAVMAQLAGGRQVTGFANRYRCADGSYRWLEWRSTPDPARHLVYAVARDVTAQHLAEAALRDSEQWLLQSQRVASLGHYVFDIGADRWTSSPVLDAIFGIDATFERSSTGWAMLIHPEDQAGMVTYLQGLLGGAGSHFDRTYRVARISDGSVRWVHGLGEVTRDAAGRPIRMFGTIQDVTDRRLAEQAREELDQKLQQSMRVEAVGRLAGGVAHDFNNLLTGIIGNVSLALMDVRPDDPQRELLLEIEETAGRAAALTRQLLAFGRKQIMEKRPLDPNALVARLERLLVRLIGEDVRLTTRPGVGVGAISGDAGQLEQVVVNLAVNARDAMPRGGTLTISTEAVRLDAEACQRLPGTSPGPHVLLSVADTGQGMTPEVQARAVEPFFTTKPAGKGTGLGLATADGIVRQHGGGMSILSQPGQGTTIGLYLPVVDEAAAELVARQGPVLPAGSEAVLLVEDEPSVRASGRRILERLGYRVVACASGKEALAVAEHGRFDLLLTDVVMPDMNGRELADRLLALQPDVAVLYTSGYTADVIGHHGVLDEGQEFVGKPYSPEALAQKVRFILDRRAHRR